MAPKSPLVQALSQALSKYPGLDPKAVLAVAAQEGLGGGIGDQGTSFGPFQLHYGGAYPAQAPHGAQASQQWAWSPEGLDYALSRIQGVAGGLHGAPAVQNIVSRFERPANVGGEISRALASYGGNIGGGSEIQMGSSPGGPAGASMAASAPSQPPRDSGNVLARAILGAIGPGGQLNTGLLLKALGAVG